MSDSDSVKKEFLDSYASVSHLTDEEILHDADGTFRPYFERMDRLVAREVHDELAEELRRDPELAPVIKHISHLKRTNGLRMEIESARSVIASPEPWEVVRHFTYYPNYLELARMECQGADLRPGDRVVFLGSGPLPLSLVSLYRQYGVEGIGIEQSPEYAELSRKLIEALELTEHIRIIQGNHFSLPFREACQLVMIGADALPKDEIFAHLAQTFPDGTKLAYRIYEKGLRRLLDAWSVFKLPSVFKEYARIRPKPPVNNTCVFIVRNAGDTA